ncbi:MAG: hypothetical protein Q8N36_03565 [bacterium]|nr:hypothetical protein [bacterium]
MESMERVGKLEVTVGRHEERIGALEGYQVKQNGCLLRLEAKMDSLNKWLMMLLGGMVVSLVLLIVNLGIGM